MRLPHGGGGGRVQRMSDTRCKRVFITHAWLLVVIEIRVIALMGGNNLRLLKSTPSRGYGEDSAEGYIFRVRVILGTCETH